MCKYINGLSIWWIIVLDVILSYRGSVYQSIYVSCESNSQAISWYCKSFTLSANFDIFANHLSEYEILYYICVLDFILTFIAWGCSTIFLFLDWSSTVTIIIDLLNVNNPSPLNDI